MNNYLQKYLTFFLFFYVLANEYCNKSEYLYVLYLYV